MTAVSTFNKRPERVFSTAVWLRLVGATLQSTACFASDGSMNSETETETKRERDDIKEAILRCVHVRITALRARNMCVWGLCLCEKVTSTISTGYEPRFNSTHFQLNVRSYEAKFLAINERAKQGTHLSIYPTNPTL